MTYDQTRQDNCGTDPRTRPVRKEGDIDMLYCRDAHLHLRHYYNIAIHGLTLHSMERPFSVCTRIHLSKCTSHSASHLGHS